MTESACPRPLHRPSVRPSVRPSLGYASKSGPISAHRGSLLGDLSFLGWHAKAPWGQQLNLSHILMSLIHWTTLNM